MLVRARSDGLDSSACPPHSNGRRAKQRSATAAWRGPHRLFLAVGEDGFAALLHIAEVHQHRRQALAAVLRVDGVVEVVEVRLVLLRWLCNMRTQCW